MKARPWLVDLIVQETKLMVVSGRGNMVLIMPCKATITTTELEQAMKEAGRKLVQPRGDDEQTRER